jgi:hypothetical protein
MSTMSPAKSKKQMQAEARAKAQKYKQDKLSPPPKKTSGAASTTPKTTPRAKSKPATATKMTTKSEQLARAQKYGEQLKLKKSLSPKLPRRTSVASVNVPSEPEASELDSQQSSLETANWTEVDSTAQNSASTAALMREMEAWECVRNKAEKEIKRLLEQNNEGSDMDTE